jgi:hypothetical protein
LAPPLATLGALVFAILNSNYTPPSFGCNEPASWDAAQHHPPTHTTPRCAPPSGKTSHVDHWVSCSTERNKRSPSCHRTCGWEHLLLRRPLLLDDHVDIHIHIHIHTGLKHLCRSIPELPVTPPESKR